MNQASEDQSQLADRSTRGLFWVFGGNGLHSVLQGAVLIVLARLLSAEEFGVAAAALIVIGFSQIFAEVGIGPAIVQRAELEDRHLRAGFWMSVVLGTLVGALVFLAAPLVAGFFRMPTLDGILRVTAPLFVVAGASTVANGLMARSLRFRDLSLIRVGSFGLGYGLVGIVLAFVGAGVWSIVIANVVQRVSTAVCVLLWQPHAKKPLWDADAARDLAVFSGGFTLGEVLNFIAAQGDNLVAGRWLGAAALGFYGRAYQLMVVPTTLVGQTLNTVSFPALAQIQADRPKVARNFRRGTAAINLVLLPATGLMIVLAPEIILVVLGEGWGEVVLPFQILSGCTAFRASYALGDALARSLGAVYRSALRQGVYAAMVLGFALFGQQWGIAGVATAILAANVGKFVMMAHLGLQLTGLSTQSFLRAHVLGVVMFWLGLVQNALIADFLRASQLSAWLVLVLTGIAWSLTFFLGVGLSLRTRLGDDVSWVLDTLLRPFGLSGPARVSVP